MEEHHLDPSKIIEPYKVFFFSVILGTKGFVCGRRINLREPLETLCEDFLGQAVDRREAVSMNPERAASSVYGQDLFVKALAGTRNGMIVVQR